MRTNSTHFYCKHALVLLLCLFVSISTMQAVPAWSGWQTKSQPDGTTIVVRQLGDEFYSYWETQDGKLAVQQADGTFVVSDAPVPTPAQVSARRKASKMYQPQPRKAIGKITLAPKGLVILVQFPDVKFKEENNKQAFDDMLNKVGYDYDGATGSARDYFYDQSNHTYVPVFDVFGPIEMPHELAYYGEQDNGPDGVYGTDDDGDHDKYMADFVMDAVFAAHDAGCNFSQYDSDEDGEVDIIYFFYAGKGQAAGGTPETIWPHNWNLTGALYNERTHCKTDCEYYVRIDEEYNIVKNLPILDGKIINNYVCSAELKYEGGRSGIGTLCHEFSHVLGMPDYYDTEYGKNNEFGLTPGEWSIMDAGSYNNEERTPPSYSIFDKYFMGWATPKHLAKNISQDVVMTTGYDDAYQISGGASLVPFSCTDTVYYIENRQNTGWDAYLPGHGMLVWQVVYDAESWSYNRLNNVAGKPRYTVKSSSGDFTLIGNSNFFNRDPFPGENDVHRFLPLQGCSFTSIRETEDGKITFSFNSGVVCRNVSATVTGCKSYKLSDDCVPENMDLVVTFEPENELYDISSLSVKVGGTELTQGTEYALSEDHRKLTVFAAAISAHSGDVTINAAWAKAFVTYKFSSTTENCTYPANGTARLGEELNLIVTPDNGYSLSVEEWCWTITSNTYTRLYMGVDFSYDRVTNTLKIFNVAGDLYIMPNAVLVDYWYADGELYEEENCSSTIYTPSPKPGNCSNGREFMGWCTNPTYHHLTDAPTFIKSGDTKEEVSTSFYAVYAQHGMPKVIGSTKSFNASTTGYIPTEYAAEQNNIIDDNFYYFAQFSRDAGTKVLKFRGTEDANGAGFVYNEYPYNDENTKNIKLHSIAITYNSADAYRNISLKIGSTKNPTSGRTITPTIKGDVYTFDCTDGELCDFFVLTNGNHEAYVDKIDINLTPAAGYLNYSTKCDETPAYTVVFRDEDGTLLGEPMVVESGKAVTAPSVHKDCYDLSWDQNFSKVTADMTVTAVWTSQKKYDWTIESEDNNKGVVIFNPEPTCKDLTLNFRAEAKDGYQFVQWSDGVTDAQRTVTLTRDTTITAQFAKLWTITWKDEDSETVLYVSTVPHGQMPVYKDGVEVPTKEPDAQNIYKFLTWIPTLKKATENATYTAYYSSERRKYTVTFMDGDEVLGTQQCTYEGSVTAPRVPSRECYTYTWDKVFSKVTEDMTVNIIWTPAEFKYTFSVTSPDESMGTVTVTKAPTCEDPTAEFRADAKDGYMFDGWSDWSTDNPRTMTINYNTELTAKWVQAVKITWKNWDGEELLTEYVKYGTYPSYSGPTPTREPDEYYTYKFYGSWTPTIEKATKNTEYTAKFSQSTRWYTVTFQYEDGREIKKQEVTYGKPASAPTEYSGLVIPDCQKVTWDKDFSYITEDLVVTAHFVSKIPKWEVINSDETQGRIDMQQEPTCDAMFLKFEAVPNDGCEFLKWSDGDEHTYRFFYLSKDTVITALWVKKWTITWNDEDGSWLKTTRVKNGEKPSYGYPSPSRDDAQYTYYFNGWTPTIVPATEDAVYTATYLKSLKQYTVRFYDDNYNVIKTEYIEYGKSATAPTDFKPSLSSCQEWSGWDKDFSFITGNLDVHPKITDKPLEYKYSVESSDPNKGTVTITYAPTSACDTKLSFEAKANDGYEFLKWSDGSTANPRTTYLMGDVNITALWQEKTAFWTITWKNGDQVLETDNNVPHGTTPTYDGATPTKAADAEFTYTFSGWTPDVVPATANATYTATFKATKNKYTVTFMNGDKKVGEDNVEYGSSATPPEIEVPDCKLLSWKPDYSNITGNLTVYAQWSDKPFEYEYNIHVSDKKMGSCTISKSPTCSSPTLTVRADANDGYRFVKWSDGATENPYTVTVDKNIELTAIFEEIEVEPVEVTGDTDIKDIVTDASTEIEVTPEAHLTVSTPTTIHSITLEYSESGHAQLSGITNLTVDEIEVKMQFPTPIGPLDEQWFAIAVPFAVSMATGIRYEGSDKPAIPGTDFIVEEYDGALRATTQRGWKSVKADATLYPGHMYMISMSSHATWYLKAADPKTLSEPTSVGISAYDSKIGAHHSGWNGIANTLFTCASGDAAGISYATTFNNKKGVYEAQATGSYVFGAAVPFFVQTAAGGVLNFTYESGTPAPLRAQYAQSSGIAAVTLSDGNYTDKAFWTVNADKQDVYTIGSDLQKMQVANAGVPQISILAYNMKLSAYEAPFDGTATIPVSLYAPAEGTYSIAVSNVPDDLNVLLMRNGNLVWDITSSPYAADLQAGDNSGYSLYVQRIKEMGTGVNNNGNETHNVQKVLFNDRIYIIRDGRTYVITGECVKE